MSLSRSRRNECGRYLARREADVRAIGTAAPDVPPKAGEYEGFAATKNTNAKCNIAGVRLSPFGQGMPFQFGETK
jgi:hypothetical protein